MGVIIGMDPHKRSATVEIVDDRSHVLAVGRYGTDKAGYAQMLAAGREDADRVWAIEGCNGIGKHIAHRRSTTARRWSTCRRSCRRRCGCSPRGTVGRRIRWMRIRIRPAAGAVRFASARDLVLAYGSGSPLATHLAGVDEATRHALVVEMESALRPWTSGTGLSFPIEALLVAATAQ